MDPPIAETSLPYLAWEWARHQLHLPAHQDRPSRIFTKEARTVRTVRRREDEVDLSAEVISVVTH
jgi:hypothetical protein